MKRFVYFRWLLPLILCCISFVAQAATVKISGCTATQQFSGYPLFIGVPPTITVSSDRGPFADVYIDDFKVTLTPIYYETSLTIDISAYLDNRPHKLQLRNGSSDYGVCYFQSEVIDGLVYSVDGLRATVVGSLQSIENALILAEYEFEGVRYPVSKIADNAFSERLNLKSVTIPNSVTSIGDYAFDGCSSLSSVAIPNSVTYIGSSAFYGCSSLSSVTIPEAVTYIGNSAFSGCSALTSFTFNAENCTKCGSQSKPAFPSTISNLTIGDKVTKIPEYFFSGVSSIESLTIPNSVTSIGDDAFDGCSSLSSVTIPNSVTSIGAYAFSDCSSLSSVTIPNSVTSIGAYAFSDCSSLSSVTIPNLLTSIGRYTFYRCSSLSSVIIPNSLTSIGDDAFDGCSSLSSVTIPEAVTYIGNSAFSGCSALTSLTFNAENCTTCSTSAFPSTISNLTLGDKVTKIPKYFFSGVSSIESLTIPNSVTSIDAYAFQNADHLKSITVGAGVLSIDDKAFYNCNIIKAFWLGNTPPEGASKLGAKINYVSNSQYKFYNQYVYQFLSSKFMVNGTIYVPVSPSDRTCDVIDCIYDPSITNLTISDKVSNKGIEMKVNNIGQYSYYNNVNIQSLTLSNSGNIGDYAFYGCNNTIRADIRNEGRIGSFAFNGLAKLQSITIGGRVTAINESSFSGCSSLRSITIPNKVKSIGDYAFSGCCSLSDVIIEESEKIDDNLKLGSNGSNSLFSDCPLDEVYIGRKLSYRTSSDGGYSPFYRNTSLRTVEITDAETQIYDNEFYGCSNLKSLKIGNGVTSIGKWAFSGCSSLDYFSAGFMVESIGEEAFSDCTGLTKYYSYSVTPPQCGNQALDDINKWECTLYVPDNSSDEYQKAAQWKDFFFMEEMDAVLVAEIRLGKDEISLGVNDKYQIQYDILPSNATNKTILWTSSNPEIASIDSNGVINAKSIGTTTIAAKSQDGNTEAICCVTVLSDAGVDGILVDDNGDIEIFNIDGVYIGNDSDKLQPGVYIIKSQGKISKIYIH